jgi:hypothetical protein
VNRCRSIRTMICLLVLTGCATTPQPRNVDSVCSIFKQYPQWHKAAKTAERTWGVPVATQMAIMHQESSFHARAKPPRERLLWVIPWRRPSSAYGYSQALDGTWDLYQQKTGKRLASRTQFADAVDFIGWFGHSAKREVGIPPNNARQLYLAYHEGLGGYKRRTYQQKPWLLKVADKVQRRAWTYNWELQHCQVSLEHQSQWGLWS